MSFASFSAWNDDAISPDSFTAEIDALTEQYTASFARE